jgi:hypothetical protein
MGRHVRDCRTLTPPPVPFVACRSACGAQSQAAKCSRTCACVFSGRSWLLKGWLGGRLGFKRISISVVSSNELKHMTTDGPMTMTRSTAV